MNDSPEKREQTALVGIKGMHCASCSARIEKVVGALDGVSRANVNLATEIMELQWDPATIDLELIADKIKG
ncbi:MAG: heavy-metal-associated domain-containing protein, partial [Desulfobulbaceae bacterium]|nr:heavy-metal-associated domain-containing protein [Desulfobulbaceae bacterium]